jgi:Xaa-Pro aminopeptidase
MIVNKRIEMLRELMEKHKIDAYIVPSSDYHNSEYTGDYFKYREFITGFTGSSGIAVITLNDAYLYTDGRYFIQAEKELSNTNVKLIKEGEEGVLDVFDLLLETLNMYSVVAFDGRTLSYNYVKDMERVLSKKIISIDSSFDLIDEIWDNRPKLKSEKVWELKSEYIDVRIEEKFAKIREKMVLEEVDALIITSLDEIAYLLNCRGGDIKYSPLFLAYLTITKDKACLFSDPEKFPEDLVEKFKRNNIFIKPYRDIYEYITVCVEEKMRIWADCESTNYSIINNIEKKAIIKDKKSPVIEMKSVKSDLEVENIMKAHIKDAVALIKFIAHLKKNAGLEKMTELSLAEDIVKFRKMEKTYLEESFSPIIAYESHGAIVHYSANEESNTEIHKKGMLLVDVGAHYLEGTTDVTRTIVLGNLNIEEKRIFTAVLRGHLNLLQLKFPYGRNGGDLDAVARAPIWEIGMDYKHGTGHGVGYLLNVHEGDNGFRKNSAVFKENMITSNEPGLYLEGRFGVRHENLMVCKKAEISNGIQYMKFLPLTLIPFDRDGIDISIMTKREIDILNRYHREVYNKISPYLEGEELIYLKMATRDIEMEG